jgi:arylsulfatase
MSSKKVSRKTLIAIVALLLAASAPAAWAAAQWAGFHREALRLETLRRELAAVCADTGRDNASWRKGGMSSAELLKTAAARDIRLRRIINELRIGKGWLDRKRSLLLKQALLGMNYSQSARHCARAVIFAPQGKQDSMCYPYNLSDYMREISETERKVSAQGDGRFFRELASRLSFGKAASQDKRKPNVIIIVIDALRADDAYNAAHAPFLAELARDGLRFDNATAAGSATHTSVASLLTGTPPHTHGMIGYNPWRNEFLISKIFKSSGYDTAAFSANSVVWPRMGFGEGFEFFAGRYWIPAEMLNNDIEAYLAQRRHTGRPVFMYIHYIDPHDPYFAPGADNPYQWDGEIDPNIVRALYNDRNLNARDHVDKEKRGAMRRRYLMEIEYVDARLRELFSILRTIGLLRNAVVVVTADHGEEFFEHGGVKHSRTLYREAVHVPLIVWGEVPESWRRAHDPARPVSHIEVAPTILEAAELAAPPWIGKSHLFLGKPPAWRYSVTQGMEPGGYDRSCVIHSVEDSAHKLILCPENGVMQMFRIRDDAREQTDVSARIPGKAERLSNELKTWIRETGEDTVKQKSAIDGETKRQLKSLGYIK